MPGFSAAAEPVEFRWCNTVANNWNKSPSRSKSATMPGITRQSIHAIRKFRAEPAFVVLDFETNIRLRLENGPQPRVPQHRSDFVSRVALDHEFPPISMSCTRPRTLPNPVKTLLL
jgi:hypothetical protein